MRPAAGGGEAPSKRPRVVDGDSGQQLQGDTDSGPGRQLARAYTHSIEDLRWHFPMLNDHERNAKLCSAVETAVVAASRSLRARGETRGVRVLDIGSGSGLLALAAARAGAEHVTACEADPLVCGVASEIVLQSGFSQAVTMLPHHSSRIGVADLREGLPVDVVTHELLDSTLLGEDVLPALRDAYARGLALPEAASVPWGAVIVAQLVESPSLWVRTLLSLALHCSLQTWCVGTQ